MAHKFMLVLAALLPALTSAQTYKATMTPYGSGDPNDSGNCNVKTTACGFYTYPGFSAAVSQNLYGVGPGQGAGPACGGCWNLTGETDSSGNPLSSPRSIVVKVTNLCPASTNSESVCSMPTLGDVNTYGAHVNFDLCINSGAADAFLTPNGIGLAVGTATQVSCTEWSGTQVGTGW